MPDNRITKTYRHPTAAPDNAPYAKRIFWLDLVRVAAIVGIVVSHSTRTYITPDAENLGRLFYGSAALFFMTSGALILPVEGSGRRFVWRRLRSYLPEWIFFTILYAALNIWLTPDYEYRRNLPWVFFRPTWTEGWFLYALTGMYLAAPLISPWLRNASQRSVERVLALWLASGLIPVAQEHVTFLPEQSILAPFFGVLGYAVAGYWLTRWPIWRRPLSQRVIFFAVTGTIGIAVAARAYITATRWGYAQVLGSDLSINVMCVCMLWFALLSGITAAPRGVRRAVSFVSQCSLGIYLCHTAILVFWAEPRHLPAWLTICAVFAGSTACAVLLRLIFGRLRKKT